MCSIIDPFASDAHWGNSFADFLALFLSPSLSAKETFPNDPGAPTTNGKSRRWHSGIVFCNRSLVFCHLERDHPLLGEEGRTGKARCHAIQK
jgi:hypothetical protein